MRTSDRFWTGPVSVVPKKPNDFDATNIIVNETAGDDGRSRGMEELRKIPLVQNLICFFGLEPLELQVHRPHRMHYDYFEVANKVTKIRLYVKCK